MELLEVASAENQTFADVLSVEEVKLYMDSAEVHLAAEIKKYHFRLRGRRV